MAERKTGALLGCAQRSVPSSAAARRPRWRLSTGGPPSRLAFQIVDDVLGIWGDPEVTGKPVHGDLRERKKTFPVLAALDSASPEARRLAALLTSGADPQEAAVLVEAAGGRAAALDEARRHIAAAETALADISLRGTAVDELRALSAFLLRRDV
ncbi:polyprenyl synthetase family protein [Streptomyces stelliscabiei]